MDKNQEEKLLDALSSSEKKAVEDFPEDARGKVLEKLDDGYTISEYDSQEIEVKKGYSYYGITRGGTMYPK